MNYPHPTAIVTGASSGIGWHVARQLAASGATVVALGRDESRLQALARENRRLVPVIFDLSRTSAIDALVCELLRQYSSINILINNAGVQDDLRVADASYGHEAIEREVAVNLTAPVALTRALLPHLQSRSCASIVNVTSSLAYIPKRTSAVYGATKAGLRLFSDALRVQLRGSSVGVIEVVMPLVDTPMTAGRGSGKISAEAAAAALVAGINSGRDRVYVGKARMLPILMRWAPTLAARLMQRT